MKNFLELTAIKPTLDLKLHFIIHGQVEAQVMVNGHQCNTGMNSFCIDLLDPIIIESNIFKIASQNSAVEIIEAKVNNYTFLPLYKHLSSNKDCWHNYIGKWQYKIEKPFYVWFHETSGQGWIA